MGGDDTTVSSGAAIMAQSAASRHLGDLAALRHGGDLAAAAAAYPDAPKPWIDLSTGVNPWPYPVPPLPMAVWGRLPGAAEEAALRHAAAGFFGVADPALVLPAAGAQPLLQALPRLLNADNVAVAGPTYAEHAAAWRAAGAAVADRWTPDAVLNGALRADILVVVNPNNPDGRIWPPEVLLQVADAQAARGGWLIVDEAFADAVPAASLAARAGRPGLIVLRSFGKFFGLAGARLGFLLAAADVIPKARALLGPWSVSGPALALGAAAYADRQWISATRDRLSMAASALDAVLLGAGLEVVGGTSLFRLVACADGAALFRRLAAAGLWTRPFADQPQRLRLGLPPDDAALTRLQTALDH